MVDATSDDARTGSTVAGLREESLAGASMLLAGSVAFMGIVTAEVLYPDYSTRQDISDLGSTLPPDPVIHQPSATIFNSTMLLTGALLLVGAYFAHRAIGRRVLTVPLGVFGVGLFPGNIVPWHGIFSLLTFSSGGIMAVLSARVARRPVSYLCVAFGLVSLASLVTALFFGGSGPVTALGSGGIERWVAYPLLLWVVGFGGYLLGVGEPVA